MKKPQSDGHYINILLTIAQYQEKGNTQHLNELHLIKTNGTIEVLHWHQIQ